MSIGHKKGNSYRKLMGQYFLFEHTHARSSVSWPSRTILVSWNYQTVSACWSVAVHCSSVDSTNTTVQASVTSRLDSFNALYYGIPDDLMRRLHSTQHAAARLATGTLRCDCISPVRRQLHWLPMRQRQRVKFKAPPWFTRCYQVLGWRLLRHNRRPSRRFC